MKGYIAVSDTQKRIAIKEQFIGEVIDSPIKFPKELGVVHPFDFNMVEKWYNGHPFVKGAIDKHADLIVSDFNVDSNENKSLKIIQNFLNNTNFLVFLKQFVTSALVYGNGFAEIDAKSQQVRILDPKTMYVVRDENGNVVGYNQYLGEVKLFSKNKKKVIPFKTSQIAHLKYGDLNGDAYALGLIWPNRVALDLLAKNQIDMHKLIGRKAGAPYHVKVGIPGEAAIKEDIDKANESLQYINNRTEWVTDANTDIKFLDFGDLGQNFKSVLDHDVDQLIFGFQIPLVLMGVSNVNEGIAKVQTETFQRRIESYQEITEQVIEEKIFKSILLEQGLQANIEITWNLPGELEINNRIIQITGLLGGTINISENMRRILEIELADALKIKDAEKYLNKPDPKLMSLDDEKTNTEMKSTEAEEESKIKQPEVPGEKPAAQESARLDECCLEEIVENYSIKEWVDLKEMAGFNYSDYLVNILKILAKDDFKDLKALTELDMQLGLLNEKEIEKLRIILNDGFKKNKTIRQIEKDINRFIKLKDRYIINETGEKVLKSNALARANAIARTETVRLANRGLIETYKDNQIKQVRFLSALSERTCAECESLNGKVYEINEVQNIIPVHSNCRCTWVGIIG